MRGYSRTMRTLTLRRAGLLALALTSVGCRTAPPKGVAGPDADALARALVAAVDGEAWEETGAVRWVFGGRNRHLWDRRRGFSQVEWSDRRVLLEVDGRVGVALEGGLRVEDADRARELLDEAHAKWTNDAFWLNPVTKVFDPGTVRERLPPEEGKRLLLVRYRSGGRTPGDAYLWHIGEDDRPVAWQMWTSNIPVGGVEASWAGWIELATGAWVATEHELPIFTLELTEVAGERTLDALVEGEDPFAALVECKQGERCVRF